ncbi:MAG TPA: hypothetical protein VFZ65_14585 [Planctomycetota bacterium]|nr:hypothetical protein [Planctomycetota bacterium]
MPTVAAKLLLLLATALVAAWQIGGWSLRPGRRRDPLDAGSAAIGVLIAVSIANNAMGYLSGAYVQWLCGDRDTAPLAWELGVMQLQVFFVVVPLVAAMFRELRRYLDHAGAPRQRFGFAAVRAVAALVGAVPLYALADRLPGLLATAAHVAASSLLLLGVETLVLAATSCVRARFRVPEEAERESEADELATGQAEPGSTAAPPPPTARSKSPLPVASCARHNPGSA